MLRELLLCSVVIASSALAAPTAAEQVNKRLTPFDTLHATFVEEKRVEGLTKPLKSTGRLVYDRPKGLLWLVEKPLASQTLMTPTRLVQRVKGRVTVALDVAAQPSMQVISRLFVASLTGDWSTLDADFAITGEVKPDSWKMVLTPKGGLFSKVAKRLEITGNTAIDKVDLFELSGDMTTTTFAGQVFNAPLTPDEETRLVAK